MPKPCDTSATRTASAPAVIAPMMGMKLAKKVMSARPKARGTPRISSPMPIATASTRATSAWARMNPPRVTHIRDSASVRCMPAVGPENRRTQGMNRPPSLRKKNVRTSTMARVTSSDPAVETPLSTPEAMLLPCCCSQSLARST